MAALLVGMAFQLSFDFWLALKGKLQAASTDLAFQLSFDFWIWLIDEVSRAGPAVGFNYLLISGRKRQL
ncbi:MAG: hypothetical protein ACPL3C_09780 [Pyrobaculum sp.]